ncbi:MarC family protein [Methylohalobius crimeensis]|uniref:MarC family protein n=1 Tax=Methylohalobius crimeensis TaxID=244365 RepID=UPI0003B427A8|nr:NAAT family transporter [Methylohalobius crimeensis]
MLFFLKAFFSFLIIVNPLDVLANFVALTVDRPLAERHAIARTATLTMTVILLAAIWLGELVLGLFDVGLPAFRVGGGIMILMTAIAMIYSRRNVMPLADSKEESGSESVAFVPLAIPIMAGPGAISLGVIYADQAGDFGGRMILTVAVATLAGLIWWVLRKGESIGDYLGANGGKILMKIVGLLLAAIGIQIIADGLMGLFPGLI